mmetsp:Transcript_38088/g.38446  ORF Transcript_38088/g.38446 Transcript_38088/m.38446 type:complete len:90 (+) Transcript_38088:2062-2331(+)
MACPDDGACKGRLVGADAGDFHEGMGSSRLEQIDFQAAHANMGHHEHDFRVGDAQTYYDVEELDYKVVVGTMNDLKGELMLHVSATLIG